LQLNGFLERTTVEEIALSDENGQHSFFSRNDQMSSLVRSGLGTNWESADVKEHLVQTERLDHYLERQQLGSPNLIKLDTEGAEINILRGAREVMRSNATIVCELHPYAWEEFNTSFAELLSMIKECGRSIRYLDNSYRIEDGPLHGTVIIS
jgi:FkbM family methyltransferase